MAHREDIQGLRAVAVLLVALGHADVPFLTGGYVGVDVFFVLSGFLITGLLLSEAVGRGYVSLGAFYVRRARRILPAAALTLVVTDVAANYLLNFVRAREAVADSISASLFTANVHFARQESDYFAQGEPASPVLHFWTLSVEEQFYFVWPSALALVLVGALFGRRIRLRRNKQTHGIGRSAIRRLLIVVAVAGAASLAWSVHYTDASPKAAYFSTFARVWEFALGATLAIAASSLRRVPPPVLLVMGWIGLLAMAIAAVVFSSSTKFPGYAALLPAVGAALVIAAGIREQQMRLGLGRLLSVAPLRYVGDRSYAFYLWHWPVLIIAVQYAGHELSLAVKLLLLVGAFLLSMISYALVENPIRRMQWPTRVGMVSWPASASVVVLIALVLTSSLDKTAARVEAASASVHPVSLGITGAARRTDSRPLPAVVAAVRAAERGAPLPSPLTPSVANLRGDFYRFPDGCTPGDRETSSRICRLGDTGSTKTIAVIGDSHAQMWMPTILRMARRDRWVVVPFVKASCTPRSWTESGGCRAWYRWVHRRASRLRPDVTLIVGSWAATAAPSRAVPAIATLSTAMSRFSASVIVVGDSPGQAREPVDCLLARNATMSTCATQATGIQLRTNAAIASDARRRGIGFIDAQGWFCARATGSRVRYLCPLVVSRMITSVDRGHASQTYVIALEAPFRTAFRRELFR